MKKKLLGFGLGLILLCGAHRGLADNAHEGEGDLVVAEKTDVAMSDAINEKSQKTIDLVQAQEPKREVVDKIIVRVNGSNILLSDLQQVRIDKNGGTYTLKERIEHELLFLKAAERKMLPKSLEVERYIVSWKEANNLTHLSEEEFEKRLRRDGLTGRWYRMQLARFLAIRNLRQLEVSERVIITSDEVEDYHKNNPDFVDDRFLLQTKIISTDEAEDVDTAKKVAEKSEWLDLDWIEKQHLADQMLFVTKMNEGDVSVPVKVDQGYQLIKVVKKEDKRERTLDERRDEIEKTIQKEKMEKFEVEYLESLKEKASIVYLDKEYALREGLIA